jgi:hypothetical protein
MYQPSKTHLVVLSIEYLEAIRITKPDDRCAPIHNVPKLVD